MTALVLAFAAGAAASSFGLGPIGVGLAQMAGGLAGGALFGPKMPDAGEYGPRLSDLRVTTSGYGNMVPIVYGTMRIPSNIIWATDKVETPHVSVYASGGKGGGGGSVTQTSYSYSISFASSLCEGPVDSVRRIWANGNLIYDIGESASQNSVAASSTVNLRLHGGGEAELPDSLIEAHSGTSPAYRGTACMVFEDLQLSGFGNDIPNLEYEVAANSSRGDLRVLPACDFSGFPKDPPLAAAFAGGIIWLAGYETLYLFNPHSGSLRTLSAPPGRQFYWGGGTNLATRPDGSLLIMEKPYYSSPGNLWIVSPEMKANKIPVPGIVAFGMNGMVTDSSGILWGFGSEYFSHIYRLQPGGEPLKVREGNYLSYNTLLGFSHPHAYFSEGQGLYRFSVETLTVEKLLDAGFYGVQGFCAYPGGFWHVRSDGSLVLVRSTVDGIELERRILHPELQGYMGPFNLRMDSSGRIWLTCQAPPRNLYRFDPGTGEWTRSEGIGDYWNGSKSPFECDGSFYVLDNYGHVLRRVDMTRLVAPVQTRLSDAFVSICKLAGLSESDIDATLLETVSLEGYVISARTSARSMLEPLMQAYFVDAVESGGKIRFVPRGSAPILTIPEEDLAAHQDDEAMPDDLFVIRQQESELPLEVSVSYCDRDADYRSGVQYARRLVTASRNRVRVDLPLALTAGQAKKISEVLLYDAWMGRKTCRFSTSMKYAFLEPTDVVDIERGGRRYTVRITRTLEESGIIRFEAAAEDPSVYVREPEGAILPGAGREIYRPSPTDLRLLDIPLLRDMDDYSGIYAAAAGYTASWPGAQLYSSSDEGASFQMMDAFFPSPSVLGHSVSALPGFESGNIFDELNFVDVWMASGELESGTMLSVLNGANAALIGTEIIQFRDAELIAQKTYKLRGLLRGRLGTAISDHEAGESFVYLDATLRRIREPVGHAVIFRAATFGTYLVDARSVEFANSGVSDRPLSPVHLGGGRDFEGNIELKWVRRTRVGREWRDYADAPLGEEAEAYELDILDGSNVLRTISSNLPAARYSAQDQIADFGMVRQNVGFRVCQLSSRMGRGFSAEGAL